MSHRAAKKTRRDAKSAEAIRIQRRKDLAAARVAIAMSIIPLSRRRV